MKYVTEKEYDIRDIIIPFQSPSQQASESLHQMQHSPTKGGQVNRKLSIIEELWAEHVKIFQKNLV